MFDAFVFEFFSDAACVKKHVNVAVAVWFKRDFIFRFERQFAVIVSDRRNEFLFQNVNLLFFEAEIVVLFQRHDSFRVCVFRSHDHEWNWFWSFHARFHRFEVRSVVLQISRCFSDFNRNVEFDSRIAQTLAQTTSNKNECSFIEMVFADVFVVIVSRVEISQINFVRLMRNKTFEWVISLFCFSEQFLRVGNVRANSAWVRRIYASKC